MAARVPRCAHQHSEFLEVAPEAIKLLCIHTQSSRNHGIFHFLPFFFLSTHLHDPLTPTPCVTRNYMCSLDFSGNSKSTWTVGFGNTWDYVAFSKTERFVCCSAGGRANTNMSEEWIVRVRVSWGGEAGGLILLEKHKRRVNMPHLCSQRTRQKRLDVWTHHQHKSDCWTNDMTHIYIYIYINI